MTDGERAYVNATEKIEQLELRVRQLEVKLSKANYENALSLSEIVRLRRLGELQDEEKHKLLTQMAELSIKLRKAERWLQIYRTR